MFSSIHIPVPSAAPPAGLVSSYPLAFPTGKEALLFLRTALKDQRYRDASSSSSSDFNPTTTFTSTNPAGVLSVIYDVDSKKYLLTADSNSNSSSRGGDKC